MQSDPLRCVVGGCVPGAFYTAVKTIQNAVNDEPAPEVTRADRKVVVIDMYNYRCVTSIAEMEDYLSDAEETGFDTETVPETAWRQDPRSALDPWRAYITGASFARAPGDAIYVPLMHLTGENMAQEEFWPVVRKFLTSKKLKAIHNAAFESEMLYAQQGIILDGAYDTMAAAQMTLKNSYEFRRLADSGLKTLVRELYEEPLATFEEVTGGKFFDELDPQDPETIRYACADADYALRLRRTFNGWFDTYMPRHRWIVENIESPAAVYIGIMEANGVPVDMDGLKARQDEAAGKIAALKREIQEITGGTDIGNSCSTRAFKDWLYGIRKFPVLRRTETGGEALDDAAITLLREWSEEHRPEYAGLFEKIQEYRKWGKIKSTYLDGYLKHVNPATGRIHPNFFALGTETGRLSCTAPNVQNMPRKTNDPIGIRNLIKAPRGHTVISCDYSQIELRVGSFYCRDEKMLQTYRTGGDIHAQTTAVIYGIPYEQARDQDDPDYKERRAVAKGVNFGVFYGLFPAGLQRNLKFKAGIEKSAEEAEQIIRNIKAGYPGLDLWQEETKDRAGWDIYTETWLGRRRYLPEINNRKDWKKRSFAERCALNTPIQGTAADILKLAMGRILAGLQERPWLRPFLQIHDELCFIVPDERVDEAVAFIKACMEPKPFPEFDVPLAAEASTGKTFGNMHEATA